MAIENGATHEAQSHPNGDKQDSEISPSIASCGGNKEIEKRYYNNHTSNPKHQKHDCFDWVSLVITVLTLCAAAIAAYEAGRLANLTQIQVHDAEIATRDQLALTAESNRTNRDIYVANERARIGPIGSSIEAELKVSEPIRFMVAYVNTGREASSTFMYEHPELFSLAKWNDGTAAINIEEFKKRCLEKIPSDADIAQTIFPTTGQATYFWHVKSNAAGAGAFATPFVVTDRLMAGEEVAVLEGCFVYETISKIHRTIFCYYFQQKETTTSTLNYCSVGQFAD
jgi:hypothetical protein